MLNGAGSERRWGWFNYRNLPEITTAVARSQCATGMLLQRRPGLVSAHEEGQPSIQRRGKI